MVKEFENIVDFIDKKYVDHFVKDPESNEVWVELRTLHLGNAKVALDLAEIYQNGVLKTNAEKIEARDTINYMYAGFLKFLPDEAFYTTPIIKE